MILAILISTLYVSCLGVHFFSNVLSIFHLLFIHNIMETEQQFCLRWNNHQSTLISDFEGLLDSQTLVDCTLAADGQQLLAHRIVLSACSPYLKTILSQNTSLDKHPIIILKDVTYQELRAMLDYMYRGEVNISQDQLGSFLKTAESLQIKGLTEGGGSSGSTDNRGDNTPASHKKSDLRKSVPSAMVTTPQSLQRSTNVPTPVSELRRPNSPLRGREGSSSPTPKRRRRQQLPSDDANIVPAATLPISAEMRQESLNTAQSSTLPNSESESVVLKKFKTETTELIQPKTEILDDYEDEDVQELDDDDDSMAAGPSQGSNSQGFTWQGGSASCDGDGDENIIPGSHDSSTDGQTNMQDAFDGSVKNEEEEEYDDDIVVLEIEDPLKVNPEMMEVQDGSALDVFSDGNSQDVYDPNCHIKPSFCGVADVSNGTSSAIESNNSIRTSCTNEQMGQENLECDTQNTDFMKQYHNFMIRSKNKLNKRLIGVPTAVTSEPMGNANVERSSQSNDFLEQCQHFTERVKGENKLTKRLVKEIMKDVRKINLLPDGVLKESLFKTFCLKSQHKYMMAQKIWPRRILPAPAPPAQGDSASENESYIGSGGVVAQPFRVSAVTMTSENCQSVDQISEASIGGSHLPSQGCLMVTAGIGEPPRDMQAQPLAVQGTHLPSAYQVYSINGQSIAVPHQQDVQSVFPSPMLVLRAPTPPQVAPVAKSRVAILRQHRPICRKPNTTRITRSMRPLLPRQSSDYNANEAQREPVRPETEQANLQSLTVKQEMSEPMTSAGLRKIFVNPIKCPRCNMRIECDFLETHLKVCNISN